MNVEGVIYFANARGRYGVAFLRRQSATDAEMAGEMDISLHSEVCLVVML